MKQLANLKPWPKTVRDYKSRLRGTGITDALREQVALEIPGDPLHRTYAEEIAKALIVRAIQGDVQAIREILDRVEGSPD